MKNIQLFHSYNYVNGTFRQHNKDIYNEHDKLLFSLLNIPNNSDLYTIKIQRILKKKSFSLKKNNNSYYTKHNLKIFLVINYLKLNNYITNNLEIPNFRLLYNIILNNIYINKNEYVHNLICFNKSFNKKILNKKNTIINNFNFYDLGDLKLDILNRQIINKKKFLLKNYIVNGKIIFYDIFIKLIDEFIGLNLKNIIFICNETQLSNFNNFNKFNNVSINLTTSTDHIKNKVWDNIVLLDLSININDLNYINLYVCINKIYNIKIIELLDIYNQYFNINFKKYVITSKLVYNILECIVFRNYAYKVFKLNSVNIIENSSLNLNNFKIINKEIVNTLCNICFNSNINIKTICDHYFCNNCIEKLLTKNKMCCPHCRAELNMKDLSYLMEFKNDIITNKINISNKIKYLIRKSSKSNILILSNNDKTIKYLKTIYNFMEFETSDIHNINDTYNCNKNIYFLENISNYNLIELYNSLMDKGYKKSILNFLN
jgi:hypothetical protein